jgi:hypothetical protein
MDREQALRTLCVYVASGIKMMRDVPTDIRTMAVEYLELEDEDKELPVGLLPFMSELEIVKNFDRVMSIIDDIHLNDYELLMDVLPEIQEMSEIQFLEYYRGRKKIEGSTS